MYTFVLGFKAGQGDNFVVDQISKNKEDETCQLYQYSSSAGQLPDIVGFACSHWHCYNYTDDPDQNGTGGVGYRPGQGVDVFGDCDYADEDKEEQGAVGEGLLEIGEGVLEEGHTCRSEHAGARPEITGNETHYQNYQ